MSRSFVAAILLTMAGTTSVSAQVSGAEQRASLSGRYFDPANGLTLERAIIQALEREPGLRGERQGTEITRGARDQAAQRPNPSASFEWRAEPGGTDSQMMFTVDWPLDLYRRSGRIAVAEREVTMAALAVADRERLLSGEVRRTYGDLLAAIRDLDLFDQQVSLTGRQLELVRARVEEGAAPPLERDLVTVELMRIEADRLLQAGRTETALLRLRRLLGMQPTSPLYVAESLEIVLRRLDQADIGSQPDVGQRVDVLEATEQVRLADAKIDLAEREGRVDLSLFGTYSRMDAGFPQTAFAPGGGIERVRGQFHYFSGGLTVALPLLDRRQGDVATAHAERRRADEVLMAARLSAETEVAVARTELQFARRALEQYANTADALAAGNLNVVRQTYELGRGSVVEVLNEQRRYLDVQRGRTQALRAMFEALSATRLATGDIR